MRYLLFPLAAALLCGCASVANNYPDGSNPQNPYPAAYGGTQPEIYGPPPGVSIGVGVGSWGRHTGGGIGFGLGW